MASTYIQTCMRPGYTFRWDQASGARGVNFVAWYKWGSVVFVPIENKRSIFKNFLTNSYQICNELLKS